LVEQNGGKSMKKERGDYSTGETAYREIKDMGADFEMKGRDVVIIDDMVAGGGTMIKAVGVAKAGGAKRILCCATHGLFLNGAIAKIREAGAEEVFASDSIACSVCEVKIADALKAAGII
jgi:ribose-phosphate pyrophosphokinase